MCEEIYKPRQKCSDIDGAFFGISFPQLFLMVKKILIQTYPSLNPKMKFKQYEQKLYGFRLYKKVGSKYYVPNCEEDHKNSLI